MRLRLLLSVGLAAFAADYRTPAGTRAAARRPGTETILPGGRMVAPLGRQFMTGPGPFGLAVSPDGRRIVSANGGPNRYSLSLLDRGPNPWLLKHFQAPAKNEGAEDDWRSVFMGLAFEDNDTLLAAEGNSGRIRRISLPGGKLDYVLQLDQGPWKDSYSGDLAFDARRGLLYVVDQANFRLAIFDVRRKRLIASARTGRLPFRVTLSPDGQRAYVTNAGMFEYKPIPGAEKVNAKETGLPFPAFGFPSVDAERGARRETERGPVDVPALGDPNVPESNSVCVIDVADPAQPKLLKFIRTGDPFGPSLGGSSPSGVLATALEIFVSNANQDTVTVIDAKTLAVVDTIALRIAGLEAYRGILPLGMALDAARSRLLVAEAGINAIGVVDLKTHRVISHWPAAWFPTAIALRDDTVYVSNGKGLGTGPNASRIAPLARSFQAELRQGALSVYPVPNDDEQRSLAARVRELNGFEPRKTEAAALPREIRHVVIIVKENRTYDEVFGDLESASNGALTGAPELARFGRRGWVEVDRGELRQRIEGKFHNITPNHHTLAERFAFSDNFYADSEVSVDGHHWIVGSYPNAWTESTLMAAYGGQKDFRFPTTAPGRLLFPQSNSSVHPEEQLEAGALWHHLERHGVPFRNFGEGFELAGVDEGPGLKPTGARFLTNVPMPRPLWENTSREYPNYNMNVPDQFRLRKFISEIDSLYVKPGKDLPQLLFIHLPNDHIAKPRPEDGYPFSASYVADNDYALGVMIEYLSQTRWWKNMAIFVTEDDAQGGVDHIDSHRTVLLVASPYARKNYASKVNTSFSGLLKTAFRLLGLPPLNLYDAAAADLADVFTDQADFTPYKALRPDREIFVPESARDPLDPKPGPKMDDPGFLRDQHRKQK